MITTVLNQSTVMADHCSPVPSTEPSVPDTSKQCSDSDLSCCAKCILSGHFLCFHVWNKWG